MKCVFLIQWLGHSPGKLTCSSDKKAFCKGIYKQVIPNKKEKFVLFPHLRVNSLNNHLLWVATLLIS